MGGHLLPPTSSSFNRLLGIAPVQRSSNLPKVTQTELGGVWSQKSAFLILLARLLHPLPHQTIGAKVLFQPLSPVTYGHPLGDGLPEEPRCGAVSMKVH